MSDNRYLKVPCRGIGKILGHKFRARYSTEDTLPESDRYDIWGGSPAAVESLKNHYCTYEGDVCERCGIVVNEK